MTMLVLLVTLGHCGVAQEADVNADAIRARYAQAASAMAGGNVDSFLAIYADDYLGPRGATAASMRDQVSGWVSDGADRSVEYAVDEIHANEHHAIASVTETLRFFSAKVALPVERTDRLLHRWQRIGDEWKLVRATMLDEPGRALLNGDAFSDPVYGFSARLPEDWYRYVCSIRNGRQVSLVSPDLTVDLDIMGLKLDDRLNPQFIALVGAQAMRKTVPGYELEGLAESSLGDVAGVRSTAHYTRGGLPVLAQATIATEGRQVFSVGVTACPPDALDHNAPGVGVVLHDFVAETTTEPPGPPERGTLQGRVFECRPLGLRFEVPVGWSAALGTMWDTELHAWSDDGQSRIVVGCRRLPESASGTGAAEGLLLSLDEAAMRHAAASKQLSISDVLVAGLPAVQSTSELTYDGVTRHRTLTVVVAGDVAVLIAADAVPAASVAQLKSVIEAAIQGLQLGPPAP